MNLAGVLIAVVLLMVLIYKKVSLIPATLVSVLVLAVTNHISFTELVMDHYAVSLSGFIAKYFMVFVTNALFGKIMEETLLAASFSKMIGKAFGDRNAVYGAMLATALLSFGGVSVFVIVFTVYPIFLATFQKADLPRKLIPACIMSSSCTFPLSMLPGGAQLNNIIPSQYIGTSPMAAFPIGVICSVVCMVFLYLYFRCEFAKARKRGEHFEADEKILERISRFQLDSGISPWLSALPLVLIIVLINVFGMDLSYAVLCASALAMVIGRKNLPNKLKTINEGVKNVGTAMVTTAASVGFGGAVLSCSGAEIILEAIAGLPLNPVILLGIASSFAGLLTGNGGGGCDVAMDLLSGQYLQMGVNPELLHRVVAIATAGFSCLPHNGMLITIMDTCGFTAKQAYKYIFISTVLNGFVCLVLAVMLGFVLYPV
ncbi:MAG: GntP family permease [Lachnospiraceae bacterium]